MRLIGRQHMQHKNMQDHVPVLLGNMLAAEFSGYRYLCGLKMLQSFGLAESLGSLLQCFILRT